MSKKKNNPIDSDFDLDAEFDFDMGDFKDPFAEDDRKPVIKVASGVKSGVTSTLKSSGFIKGAMKAAFPPSLGQAIDLSDKVSESVKSLYDESAKEIKPTLKQAKNTVNKLIPSDSKFLPKGIKQVLDRWRAEDREESANAEKSEGTIREELVAGTLRDIFASQEKSAHATRMQEEARSALKEGVDMQRYRSMLDLNNRAAISLARIDSYNTTITLGYQKKSLEIKYRQLFAAQDTLRFMREDAVKRDSILLAISKNTALPEFVKIKDSELQAQLAKTKRFSEGRGGSLFNLGDMYDRVLENAQDKITDSIREMMQGAQQTLMMANMAGDASGMGDKFVSGGEMVGSTGASYFGQKLAKMGGEKLMGSSLGKKFKLKDQFAKLSTAYTQGPAYLKQFKNKDLTDSDDTLLGGMKSFFGGLLQDLIPGSSPDMKLGTLKGKDMDSPYHFTRGSDRSLNEIIPGYLARIYRELQVTRTGNTKIRLTEFSHESGRFTSADKIEAEILSRVAPKSSVERSKRDLEEMIDKIDPNGELDEKQRDIIRKQLLKTSIAKDTLGTDKLTSEKSYKGEGHKKADLDKALPMVKAYLDKLSPEERDEFVKKHVGMSDGISDTRQTIQNYADLGHGSKLKAMGIVSKNGESISTDGLVNQYLKIGKTIKLDKLSPIDRFLKYAKSWVVDLYKDRYSNSPAVTIEKILSGDVYEGSTSKPITNVKKLKGALTDSNGSLLIGKGELDGLHFYNPFSRKKEPLDTLADVLKKHSDYKADTDAPTEDPSASDKPKSMKDKVQDTVNDAKRAMGNAANAASAMKDKLADVYVDGESDPRVTAQQIASGVLFNETTGKFVKSMQDLVGTIRNADGKVLITKAEAARLVFYDAVSKVKKSLSSLVDGFQAKIAGLSSMIQDKLPSRSGLLDMLKSAKSKVMNLINGSGQEPVDVYVEGEDSPRMTAAGMQAGEYADKETGDTIVHQSQIKGEVIDKNNKIVLRLPDLPNLKYFNVSLRRWSPLWIGKKILQGAWWYQTKIAPKWTAWNLKMLWKGTKFAARMASSALGLTLRVLGIQRKIPQDIYVQGDPEVRLTAIGLKNGEYKDLESGKVLYNHDDITGAVIDKNGQIVLREEDLDKIYFLESGWKKINPLRYIGRAMKWGIGKAKTGIQMGAKSAWNNLKALGRFTVSATKSLLKGAATLLGLRFEAQDVYVNGQDKPSLVGKLMKLGKYFSALTKKPITSPSDIDGEVVDESGQTVLSESELKNGLRTVDGKRVPVKKAGGFMALMGKIFNPKFKTGINVAGNRAKKGMPKATTGETAAIKSSATLEKILDTIKSMGGKKTRKGSYEDELAQSAAEKEAAAKAAAGKGGKDGKSSGGKSAKGSGDAEDSEGGLWGIIKGYLGGKIGSLLGKSRIGGLLARALGMGALEAGAGALAGTAATGAAAAGGAAATTAAGAAAAGAASAGTISAGTLAGTGLAATIGGAVATIGSGLLAFVSSPFVLGAAAAALVGYGLYRGYKSWNAGKVSALNQIRIVQYGIPGKDESNVKKIIALESYLMDYLVEGKTSVDLNFKKMSRKDLMATFDLDAKDERHVNSFFKWMQTRFKGVFLTHMTAIKAITGKADLSDLDSLKKEDKLKYLEAVKYPEGSYGFTAIPTADKNFKATEGKDVEAIIAVAKEELGPKKDKAPSRTDKLLALVGIGSASAEELPKDKGLNDKVMKPDSTMKAVAANKAPSPAAPPDAEAKVATGGGGKLPDSGAGAGRGSNYGALVLAGGELYDGRNAASYYTTKGDVDLDNLNPTVKKNLMGMIEEYGTLTGKKLTLNDAFRSYAKQAAMKAKYGDRAAAPGNSLHEFGLAIDGNPVALDEMDKMGLMRKYGFTRPVGGEPWHVEPIGIQENLNLYKKDPNLATQAVLAGMGKGGGGIGSIAGSKKYSRDVDSSIAIAAAAVKAGAPADLSKAGVSTAVAGVGGGYAGNVANVALGNMAGPKPTSPVAATAMGTVGNLPNGAGGMDGEIKTMVGGVPARIRPGAQAAMGLPTASSNSPADPTIKVPDPTGPGVAGLKDTITAAAKMVGVDPNQLLVSAAVESSFDPNAKAGSSSATGLFQFTSKTWKEVMSKYGSKYGFSVDATPPTDAKASAIMAAHYMKDAVQSLGRRTKRTIGAVDTYLTHFLGPSGAGQFIEGMEANPNGVAAETMRDAAKSNTSIFFDGRRARSYREIYSLLDKRIRDKASAFGLSMPASTEGPTTTATAASGMGAAPTATATLPTAAANAPVDPTVKPSATGVPYSRAARPLMASSGYVPTPTAPSTPTAVKPPVGPSMGAAYGINTTQAATAVTPTSPPLIDKSLMQGTESILSQQLSVQQQMLDIMNKMFGLATQKASTPVADKATSPSPENAAPMSTTYTVPKPPISMKRIERYT